MGYQTALHSSLGLPYGFHQFMPLTEGTPVLFESEWVNLKMFFSKIADKLPCMVALVAALRTSAPMSEML